MRVSKIFIVSFIFFCIAFSIQGYADTSIQDTLFVNQPIILKPPTNLYAKDTPNDAGKSITIDWKKSASEGNMDDPNILPNYPDKNAFGVYARGNYVYLASGYGGLQILSTIIPGTPQLVNKVALKGFAHSVYLSGNYVYVISGDAGVYIIDIIVNEAPRLISNIDTDGYANKIKVSGNYAFIADGPAGVQIVDISDPANPKLVSKFTSKNNNAQDLEIWKNYLYVANGKAGLQLVDISDITNPKLLKTFHTKYGATSLAVGNIEPAYKNTRYVYLADMTPGELISIPYSLFRILSVSPDTIRLFDTMEIDGSIKELVFADDNLFIANGNYGVAMFDLSTPDLPKRYNQLKIKGDVSSVFRQSKASTTSEIPLEESSITRRYIYIASGRGGLQIVECVPSENILENYQIFILTTPRIKIGPFFTYWNSRELQGKKINSLLFAHPESEVMYAGTNVGIYKSTDYGNYWTEMNQGLPNRNVKIISADSKIKGLLYALTDDGLFITKNGGRNWSKIAENIKEKIKYIATSSNKKFKPDKIFAITESNIYSSSDAGNSWNKEDIKIESGIKSIATNKNGTIYIVSEDGNLYKKDKKKPLTDIRANNTTPSPDAGNKGKATLENINIGIFYKDDNQIDYEKSVKIENWIITFTSDTEFEIRGTVTGEDGKGSISSDFKSLSGRISIPAKSWKGTPKKGDIFTFSTSIIRGNVSTVACHPNRSEVIYAGTTKGIFKSQDGGLSWAELNRGIEKFIGQSTSLNQIDKGNGELNIRSIIVSDEVSNLVFVALEDAVLRSADGVSTSWAKDLDWLETYKRDDVQGFTSLALSPNNPFVLFAGTQSGVFNYIFPSIYLPAGTNSTTISTDDKKQYYITVRASTEEGSNKMQHFFADSDEVGPAKSYPNWFHKARLNLVIILGLFLAFVLFYIHQAEKGKSIFVRRIPGLDAISEAVGRATEMGKPVLYVPGIDDMNNIQTIASMVILQSVSKIVAEYDSSVIVPICRPFVVPVAEETVKQGFLDAGRPDGYNPDNVRYISDEQFAYTAGVNGIMMREKPAANLYLGSFFAESLLLAETGFAEGAIQVSGTANVAQLPFFVAACDFTLIGEELFAASAYLSREPKLLGPLKASDLAKLLIMIILVIGFALEMAGITGFTDWFTVQ